MDQMGRDVDGLSLHVATMGQNLDRTFLTPLATGLTKADAALGTFDRAVARARAETGDFSRALTDVGVTSTLVSRQIGSSWDTLRQDVGRTTTSVDVDTRRLDSRLRSVGSNSLLMAQEVAAAWDRMTGSTTRSAVAVMEDADREASSIRDIGTGALMSAQQVSSGFQQMTAAERDLRGETDRSTLAVVGDLRAQQASVEALRDAYLELAVAAHAPRGGAPHPGMAPAGFGLTTDQILASMLRRDPSHMAQTAAGLWGVRGATKSGSRENPIGTVTLAGQQFLGGLAASNAASALRQDAGTTTGTHDPQMVSLIDTLRHMDATPSDLSPKSISDLRDAIVAAEAMRKPTSGTAATTRGLGGLDTDLLSSINDSLNNIEREVGILDVKAGMPGGTGGGRRGGGQTTAPPRGESTVAIDSAQYAGLLAALRDAGGGGGGGGPPIALGGGGGGGDGGGGGMGQFLSALLWGGGANRGRGRLGRWLMPGIGAGALSLGAMAGLGPEHIVMTGLGIAGSAATALGGAGMLGLGAAGQMAVGGGSDLAVMKSTLGDTQQLYQAYNKLSTAVAVYGASSRQAAVAQSQLNDTINTLGGPNAPGVKAEMQLAKNVKALNTLWDKSTQQARVQAVNIMEQVVGLGTKFVPLIARAAQQNLAIINSGLKPLFGWLEGPQGVGIFNNLENNFRRSLPTAVHAFDMSVEGLLKLMSQASNHTGGFVTSLDHLATRFNNWAGSPRAEATITRLIDDFRTWGKFVRALGEDIYLLFKNDAGTGHDIIVTLTGMLQKLGDWEKSTQGRQQLHNIFEVHKEEVLALLRLLPLLLAPLGRLYLTIAPALTEVVTALAKAVGFLVKGLSEVGPAAQYLLALGVVGGKLFGFKTMLTAIGGALGIIKKEAPAAAEGLLAVDAAAAGGGVRGGRTTTSAGGSFLSLGGGTSTATVAREEAAAETSLRGRISGFAGRMGTMIKGGLTNGLNLFMRGGAIALLGSTLVGVVSQGFHGGTKDAINKIGGDAAIGAGIGSVFGPEGAAGGAIIGGLIGTLMSFTNHHAQDEGKRWAQEFSKGTEGFLPAQLHDQLQTNLSHHLGRAFQAQQDAANLRTAAQAGRTGPGGQPPGATTADFNRWYNEMFLAGKTAADQFNRAFSSVKYKSTPSFILGATQALRSLPPEARKEAANSIINYAAGLERNKQLPKNSMRAILGAIEQQFPSLRSYLRAQGLATARDVAATYKFTQARNNVIGWISGLRTQFGLFNVDADVTGKNWAKNYKTTVEDLIRFSHDKDPSISGPALAALKQLRDQGKAYIGALKKTIEADIPAMAVQIRDGIPGAVPNAVHAFNVFASNLQTLVDAGLIDTKTQARLLNGEMDKLLSKFKDPVKKMTLSVELNVGVAAGKATNVVNTLFGLPTHAVGGWVVPGDHTKDGTLALLSGREFVVTADGQKLMEQRDPGLLAYLQHHQASHFPGGGKHGAHQAPIRKYAEGGLVDPNDPKHHRYNMAAAAHMVLPVPTMGASAEVTRHSMSQMAQAVREGSGKVLQETHKTTQQVVAHYTHDIGREVPNTVKKSVADVEQHVKNSKVVPLTTKQTTDAKTQWQNLGKNTEQINKDLFNWLDTNWNQQRQTQNKTWTRMSSDIKGAATQQHTDVKNITSSLQKDATTNFNTLAKNTAGSFDAMSKHVDQRSNDMKTSVTKKTSDAASSGKSNIDDLEKSIYNAMDASVSVTGTGVDRIGSDLDKALKALGVAKISIPAMSHTAGANPLHHAGGGLVQVGRQGQVGRDSLPLSVSSSHGRADIVVAPGEKLAVINRHQEPIIDRALSREGFAGLPGLFNNVKKPHYMATGGFAPGFAGGGFWVRTGATIDPTGGQTGDPNMTFAELLEAGTNQGLRPDLTQLLHLPRTPRGNSAPAMPFGTAIDIRMPGGHHSWQIRKNDVGSGQPGNPHYTIDLHPGIARALRWGGNSDVEVAQSGTDPNATVIAGSGTGAAGWTNINAPKVTGKGPISDMVRKVLSDVTDAANKYGAAHVPTPSAGAPGTWSGGVVPGIASQPSGYFFPFPKGMSFQWNRIDQGQDLQERPGGPVLAIAPGNVSVASDAYSGFGPYYATEQITSGPLSGRGVYYGHTKAVKTGHVNAGDVIAVTQSSPDSWTMAPAGWLELGFLPYGSMTAGNAMAPVLHSIYSGHYAEGGFLGHNRHKLMSGEKPADRPQQGVVRFGLTLSELRDRGAFAEGGMVDIPSDAMPFQSGGLPSRYGNTQGTHPYVHRRPSSRQRGHRTRHTRRRSGSGTGVYSGERTPKTPKPPKLTDLKLNDYLQKYYPQAYQAVDYLDQYVNAANSVGSWEQYLETLRGGGASTAYDDSIVQVTDAQGNTTEVENQHGMNDPQPPHHFIPGEEQWAGWPVGTGGWIGAVPRGDNDGTVDPKKLQRPMTFLGALTKELDYENAASSIALSLQTQMAAIKAQTQAQKDLNKERADWLANAVDPNYPFEKLKAQGEQLGTYTYTKNFQFRPPWPGATMRKWQEVVVKPWYTQYWDEIHQYRNMQARVDWIEKKKERLGIGKTRATTHITDHFRGLRRDVQLRAAGSTFNARNLLSGQLGKLTSQERRDLGYTRASHIPPASWLGDTSSWRRQGVLDEAEIQSIFETQRQKLISIENKSEFQGAIDRIRAMAALGTAETDAKAALSEKYTGIRADMNDAIKADKGVASEDKRQVNLAKKQATTDASAYSSLWTAIGNPDDGSGVLGGIAKYTNPMGDFEIGRLELIKTISDVYQVVKDLGGVGATVADANKAAAAGGDAGGTGSEVAQQLADLRGQQVQQLGEALAVSQAQYAQLANIGDLHFGFGGFFDSGGIIPGPLGSPQVVVAHGGETVLPTHKQQPIFQVIVQDGAVDSSKIRIIANGEVQRVTRGYAGAAGRGLPSAGGGI